MLFVHFLFYNREKVLMSHHPENELLIKVNGVYYKRVDRPCSYWKLLPMDERRARMREYMRQYRQRKRKHVL